MQHVVNPAPVQRARNCSGVTNIWKDRIILRKCAFTRTPRMQLQHSSRMQTTRLTVEPDMTPAPLHSEDLCQASKYLVLPYREFNNKPSTLPSLSILPFYDTLLNATVNKTQPGLDSVFLMETKQILIKTCAKLLGIFSKPALFSSATSFPPCTLLVNCHIYFF